MIEQSSLLTTSYHPTPQYIRTRASKSFKLSPSLSSIINISILPPARPQQAPASNNAPPPPNQTHNPRRTTITPLSPAPVVAVPINIPHVIPAAPAEVSRNHVPAVGCIRDRGVVGRHVRREKIESGEDNSDVVN